MINKLKETINEIKTSISSKRFYNKKCRDSIIQSKRKLRGNRRRLKVIDEAIDFVNDVAMARRKEVINFFEKIISDALKLVYDDDFKISLDYSIKYRRPMLEVRLNLSYGAYKVERGVEGFGGGVQDTVATPMRLVMMVLVPSVSNILVIDENWKHLDSLRIARVGEFLKFVCDKLNLQVIFFTQHDSLSNFSDLSLFVECKSGVSSIDYDS